MTDVLTPPDNLFEDSSTIPESNWFKFETIGDNVQGILAMEQYSSEGKFGTQQVYVLTKADGTEVNVALKHSSNKRAVQQLKSAEVGDILAFKYTEDIDTGKGFPAKAIEVRVRHMHVSNVEKSGI
jgi:hypothetical protein